MEQDATPRGEPRSQKIFASREDSRLQGALGVEPTNQANSETLFGRSPWLRLCSAVILAGGGGTRLWPLSRTLFPKQLLSLDGGQTLLQQTASRLLDAGFDPQRIVTVTHRDLRFEVAGQLLPVAAALPPGILAEPVAKNTLPAVAWAVGQIAREDPRAVVGVFPADHAIDQPLAFRQAVERAVQAAREGWFVLLGVPARAPETGFGYVQAGASLAEGLLVVDRFVEKPDLASARQYVAQGGYFWNAGIFFFPVDRFQEALARFEPAIHQGMERLLSGEEEAAGIYATLPSQSMDYGIMERVEKVAVVPVDMGWSDLGSWEAVYQRGNKDGAGNVQIGQVHTLNAENNLLFAEEGFLAAVGVSHLAVVQTRDAVLVMDRSHGQSVREVVAWLKQKGNDLAECHATVVRPWGSYTVLEEGEGYKIKRIVVHPGKSLSLQKHLHRAEHWVVVAGEARVTHGEKSFTLVANQSTYIPTGCLHRLSNPGGEPLRIIEVQSGPYLGEDDIIRLEDSFGRDVMA